MIYLVGMAMVLLFAVCCALLRQLNIQQKSQSDLLDRLQTMASWGLSASWQQQERVYQQNVQGLEEALHSTTGEVE